MATDGNAGALEDIAELESLLRLATRRRVRDALSLEIRKLESQIPCSGTKPGAGGGDTAATGAVGETRELKETRENRRYRVKLNGYGWDQSDRFVKVFVTLKDVQSVPAEAVRCTFTESSMELVVSDLGGKDYALTINGLLRPIAPSECHHRLKTDAVVVHLAKAERGVHWSHVTHIEKRFEENKADRFKTDPARDPQDSLIGLMRNMYETGDDDVKRMITKAWIEGQEKRAAN